MISILLSLAGNQTSIATTVDGVCHTHGGTARCLIVANQLPALIVGGSAYGGDANVEVGPQQRR